MTDIAVLIETWRRRQDLLRAKNRLILQGKAICRRFVGGDKAEGSALFESVLRQAEIAQDIADKGKTRKRGKVAPGEPDMAVAAAATLAPYTDALLGFKAALAIEERDLEKMAAELPIWATVEETPGLGALQFAGLVAEAGEPLSDYRTVSGLWKRFGLAVIDGERQRKCADKEKAERHGYAPQRRSLMWSIGEGVLKAQLRRPKDADGEKIEDAAAIAIGALGEVYLARKQYETERNPEIRPITAHLRAKRYTEKRLLRQLYAAWRAVERGEEGRVEIEAQRTYASLAPTFLEAAE